MLNDMPVACQTRQVTEPQREGAEALARRRGLTGTFLSFFRFSLKTELPCLCFQEKGTGKEKGKAIDRDKD